MSLTKSTPICVNCGLFMRCERNGQLVRDPEVEGFPSTFWSGDIWKCPKCDIMVITGFGNKMDEDRAIKFFGRESVDWAVNFKWNPE